MNRTTTARSVSLVACVVAISAAVTPAALNAVAAAYQARQAEVVVVCPLTVGGRFEARTNAMAGDLGLDVDQPGRVIGSLSVDLRTLRTGISLRDSHLRENYLEVGRGSGFDAATLKDIHVGASDLTNIRAPFRAVLMLHGQERKIEGTAEITAVGEGFRVSAVFPLIISDFQIPKPTYLGVGVSNEIRIKVTFTAAGAREA